MREIGILVSIILLLIGNVYAEDDASGLVREDFIHRISNDTINGSVDELDTNATLINGSDDMNVTEDLEDIENKSSPGFGSAITMIIFLLIIAYRYQKI